MRRQSPRPFRVRFPSPPPIPEYGLAGPATAGWWSHLVHLPLIARPGLPGLAAVRTSNVREGRANLVPLAGSISFVAEILQWLGIFYEITRHGELVIHADALRLRWALRATVPADLVPPGLLLPAYDVVSADAVNLRLRRRDDRRGGLPSEIIGIVIADPAEAWAQIRAGNIEVGLALDDSLDNRDERAKVNAVRQLLRIHSWCRSGEPMVQVVRLERLGLRQRVSLGRLCIGSDRERLRAESYGNSVVVARDPLPKGPSYDSAASLTGPVRFSVVINRENPRCHALAAWLCEEGEKSAVGVNIIEGNFSEVATGTHGADASLLTVGRQMLFDEASISWPLTWHVDLPTVGTDGRLVTLLHGSFPIRVSQVVKSWAHDFASPIVQGAY